MERFFANTQSKVYVAGHNGLVGSAIVRALEKKGYTNLIMRSSRQLDLRDSAAILEFFCIEKPEYVFLAAARVGGIHANNTYPAEFIYDNLMIQCNVINASCISRVKKLLFLGSSCIYPKLASQPLKEEYLLTGPLEPTNEPYAVAKIAGIKMCQSYNSQYGTRNICVMPTNLYGPNDNYDLDTSHVLPALIRKFHEAKVKGDPLVTVWGTGSPRREFLHVDDLADACLFLMENYEGNDLVNIGTGEDLKISELAAIVRDIVGYRGDIRYDSSKPDGTPRKLLDVTRIRNLGWRSKIGLAEGIAGSYDWYIRHLAGSPSI
ncbi:MAG: GDP-L-fucose synthase [Firmicutes bacterium]|nr:GDP-L-fucose synthase [Bacillota bacterium]